MRKIQWLGLTVALTLFVAGCTGGAADRRGGEAEIRANLAKLGDEDRQLAEAQQFCAVEDDNRLGSMGVPIKLMLKDQPVFICCKNCKKEAEKDADKTLAKVKELKAKVKAEEKK